MPSFLHLADIHLGFDKYNSPPRTRDFYYALSDVIERYAIAPSVDFVVIAGDLFEHRQIMPFVLNQAQLCLARLRHANIPVFAIEGNHDYRPYGTKTSWLRYLADWENLVLLEPNEDSSLSLWNPETRTGGYFDLDCGVRIIGSQWYGSSAPLAIQKLATHIQNLPSGPAYTVMMFHHGLEGYVSRYAGALRYQDFMPLKEAGVDYLALGHIHREYNAEGWIFNPGSLEANSIVENQDQNPRGAYLVELSESGVVAQHHRDYTQRAIFRFALKVNPQQTPEDVRCAALDYLKDKSASLLVRDAIVELRLHGNIGFDRLEINVRELQEELKQMSKALIFLLKYEVTGVEYQTFIQGEDELPPRVEIERTIFTDLVAANVAYRDRSDVITQGLMDLKEKALAQESEVDLYQFVESLLAQGKGEI